MEIKAYGPSHLTSYLIKLNNHFIMLDFNCEGISNNDLSMIDYIFVTHEHLDHIESLLDYEIINQLNPNVRLFSTKTTKELIEYIVEEKIVYKQYNKNVANKIRNIIQSIEIVYFNEDNILEDGVKFRLYRSGHTFGSSMVYLMGDYTILYTGDIDYVKRDANRRYVIPYGYNINVDYLIVDGTRLFNDDYKGVSINQIIKFINERKNKTLQFYYKVRPEKAVLYALSIADKLDDFLILYNSSLKWYLKPIMENGYDPFVTGKVIYADPSLNSHPNEKSITFISDTKPINAYVLNQKLSLHITKNDLIDMIESHFENYPKILIGHYNPSDEGKEIDGFQKYQFLKRGVNEVD